MSLSQVLPGHKFRPNEDDDRKTDFVIFFSLTQPATRKFYGSFCPRNGSLNFFAMSGQNSLRTSRPTSCIIP